MQKIYSKILKLVEELDSRFGDKKISTTMYEECKESLDEKMEEKSQIEGVRLNEIKSRGSANKIVCDIHMFTSGLNNLTLDLKDLIEKIWFDLNELQKKEREEIEFDELRRYEFWGDVSLLKRLGERFLLSNGCFGVSLLSNDELNVTQNIFFNSPKHIDYVYTNPTKNKLLLHDSSSSKLIYIDVETGEHAFLELGPSYDLIYFSPVYYWSDNIVIFVNKEQFYYLDIEKKEIDSIDSTFVSQLYPDFYNFYLLTLSYDLLTVSSLDYQFTFKDRSQKVIGCFDFLNKKTVIAPLYEEEIFDALYQNGSFLLLSKKKLYTCSKNGKIGTIVSRHNYDFVQANFLFKYREEAIIILAASKDSKQRVLYEYTMKDENLETKK